jgi:hypothetical protein
MSLSKPSQEVEEKLWESRSVEDAVAGLHSSPKFRRMATEFNLAIQAISWEDTGRWKNSCWGPNISDMTLRVVTGRLMPMVRRPNFEDVTADFPPSVFHLTVGARRDATLKEYLQTHIKDVSGTAVDLWRPEDEKGVLVSAQACILPLADDGSCEFSPFMYNYQQSLLVIVATTESTTAQVMNAKTQPLYVMDALGKACNLLAKRLRDDRKERGKPLEGPMDADERERNVVLVFSVPLKPKFLSRGGGDTVYEQGCTLESVGACLQIDCLGSMSDKSASFGSFSFHGGRDRERSSVPRRPKRGMDHAMLRVGKPLFDFPKEALPSSHTLVRDKTLPVRVTVQRYRLTDTHDIPREVFVDINDSISTLYGKGTAQGSLVVDDAIRPTSMLMDGL